MTHIPAEVAATKPIEVIHPDHLPDAQSPEEIVAALEKLLQLSEEEEDVRNAMHAPMHTLYEIPLVHKLIPGLEELANKYHIGNFVLVRTTGERIFESMPIYPR